MAAHEIAKVIISDWDKLRSISHLCLRPKQDDGRPGYQSAAATGIVPPLQFLL